MRVGMERSERCCLGTLRDINTHTGELQLDFIRKLVEHANRH